MNTRFHVPSKVFGTRRSRGERPDGDPGSQSETSVVPASITGTDPLLIDPMLNGSPGKSCSYLIQGEKNDAGIQIL